MSRRTLTFWELDWWTVGLYFGLATLGWSLVHSAGYDPSQPTSMLDFDTRAGKQFIYIIISSIVGFTILFVNPQLFKTFAYPLYGVFIFLLILVMTYGAVTNGAMSWFQLPGGLKFQPSEFTKLATCLTLATYLSSANTSMKNLNNILVSIGIFALPALLVVLQGDPGTALVFFALMIPLYREGLTPIIYIMAIVLIALFVSSLMYDVQLVITILLLLITLISVFNLKSRLFWFGGLLTILGLVLWFYPTYPRWYSIIGLASFFITTIVANFIGGKKDIATLLLVMTVIASSFSFSVNYLFNQVLEPHQQDRINVWLMPDKADKRGSYYNLRQSKLAIGSGGLWGKGITNGEMTQGNHVPEQDTDFIFTVVGEEQGFFGAAGVIILYMILLVRLTIIAERQRARFTRIYAYGVAGIISFHLMVNIGMTMGLMPVIGIPLPLLSYGGSSLLSFTVMIAILLRFDSQRLLVFR